ncbi:hypothetical protein F5Y19DRAFT_454841 [Xylariaceae sp. FL1651]|nr:hypothetical protein F5Y19DRAFT_454841 [Xylariaceae sp. FL1651]
MDLTSTPTVQSTTTPGLAQTRERSETPLRISAPYGQACTSCAKAKCKCIISSSASSGPGRGSNLTCERCARLGRECKPPSGVRKRAAASSRRAAAASVSAGGSSSVSAASRAANLEQKLEDLVAILKAQAGSVLTPASSGSSAGEPRGQGAFADDLRPGIGVSTGLPARHSSSNVAGRAVPGGSIVTPTASTGYATCSTTNSTPSPQAAAAHDTPMSAAQAEETLDFFRQHFLRFFPFVYIPPEMSAAQLQHSRPYLWLNIRAICCKSPTKQAALHLQCREELARKMLVNCERNIDMLLGALAYLGWTMHFFSGKPILNAIMNMALSIVTDLRLDKATQEANPKDLNCFKAPDFIKLCASTVRTNEERRATLACYAFCSSGSAFLRCQSMRWTAHMEDSLRILTTNPEWEGDQILVLMVRIRKLLDNVSQVQATWAPPDCDASSTSKPPIAFYIKHFRHSLQSIKDQLPEPLKDNRFATSLILSAAMIITDMPFSNCVCWCQTPEWYSDTRSVAQPHPRTTDIAHLEAVYATLQTSKAFFEDFLDFGLSDILGFSFPILLSFFRASQILYRLMVMDEPDWDRSAVTNGLDLLGSIELIASRYAELPKLYGYQAETDAEGNEVANFYTKCSKTFSLTVPMWRAHFAQAEASKTRAGTNVDACGGPGALLPPALVGAGSNLNTGTRAIHPGLTNFMLPDLFPMDFSMDDAWCSDYLSSWDVGFGVPPGGTTI